MRGIAGLVCKGNLDEMEESKKFKEIISDQESGWKGFEGETILAACIGCGYDVMASNERYACLLDGTINNREEVFELLTRDGHILNKMDDVHMMMQAYMEWGEECVNIVKGVFLTAIWDDEEKCLFILTDKMGQKPLYYAEKEDSFVFASHVNLLIQYCGVAPVIDGGSLAELIGLYPLRTPEFGILRGVSKLRPAHFIQWTKDELKIRRYWSLKANPHTDNLAITAQRVRFMVKDSISSHLKEDENVCSFLSGGISSTANAAIAANYLAFLKGERIDTYSFDFKDVDKDFTKSTSYQNSDKQWAERVSREFYTKHKHLMSSSEEILHAFDLLCEQGNLLHIPIYESVFSEVYGVIGKRNNVLLSGTGAWNIFWDYYFEGIEWQAIIEQREEILTPEMAFYADTKNYFQKHYEKELDKMPKVEGEGEDDERRRADAYLMFHWQLANEIGAQTALAQGQGVTLRLPLCEEQLAQYVWNIPYSMKILGSRDKGILRLAMKGILPDDVIERKKRPCPMPYTAYLEEALTGRLTRLLEDDQAPIHRIISKEVLKIKDLSLYCSANALPAIELYAFLIQLSSWMEKFDVKVN